VCWFGAVCPQTARGLNIRCMPTGFTEDGMLRKTSEIRQKMEGGKLPN
jgi:hypothetical protein